MSELFIKEDGNGLDVKVKRDESFVFERKGLSVSQVCEVIRDFDVSTILCGRNVSLESFVELACNQ